LNKILEEIKSCFTNISTPGPFSPTSRDLRLPKRRGIKGDEFVKFVGLLILKRFWISLTKNKLGLGKNHN
jgi:hypothetical protein